MNSIEPSGFSVGAVEAYRGRGTRGWHAEVDDQAREFVVIERGAPFDGEWPQAQVWQVIDGQGRLSAEATVPSAMAIGSRLASDGWSTPKPPCGSALHRWTECLRLGELPSASRHSSDGCPPGPEHYGVRS